MKIKKLIIASNEKDFFKHYLKVIRPISRLTESEEKLIILLEWLCRINNTSNLFKIVKTNKQLICEKLGITEGSLASSLSTIRKKKVIIDNELNPSLVLYNEDYKYDNFNLSFEFKLDE